ncbi:hypothetical protein [Vibrio sp.]|uniref:hypothetical protein n=1 Tax=Vibrio sp. TaxID=678 RepID=UPI00311D3232
MKKRLSSILFTVFSSTSTCYAADIIFTTTISEECAIISSSGTAEVMYTNEEYDENSHMVSFIVNNNNLGSTSSLSAGAYEISSELKAITNTGDYTAITTSNLTPEYSFKASAGSDFDDYSTTIPPNPTNGTTVKMRLQIDKNRHDMLSTGGSKQNIKIPVTLTCS